MALIIIFSTSLMDEIDMFTSFTLFSVFGEGMLFAEKVHVKHFEWKHSFYNKYHIDAFFWSVLRAKVSTK